jgi:hypothetical protein
VILADAVVVGCSSTRLPPPADADGDAGGVEDEDGDVPGDATHKDDQPAPDTTYACAVEGGFGWSCSRTVSGPDPAECTDPRFPICFAGGQGARCTAACGDAGVAACPIPSGADAGCVPTDCNARGYCK